MVLVKNAAEFKKVYYYDEIYLNPEDYPKEYPCIVEVVSRDAGIMGDYMDHHITYIPKTCDTKSFIRGFEAGRKGI